MCGKSRRYFQLTGVGVSRNARTGTSGRATLAETACAPDHVPTLPFRGILDCIPDNSESRGEYENELERWAGSWPDAVVWDGGPGNDSFCADARVGGDRRVAGGASGDGWPQQGGHVAGSEGRQRYHGGTLLLCPLPEGHSAYRLDPGRRGDVERGR